MQAPGVMLQQVTRTPGINAHMLGRWRKAIETTASTLFLITFMALKGLLADGCPYPESK